MIPLFAFQDSEMISVVFRLPRSILVIMWFLKGRSSVFVVHCDLLLRSCASCMLSSGRHMQLITIFSLPHHLLSKTPIFCFSLDCKSGPSAQDLLHNLCPPKYVFPLAARLHLEFSPGRENIKIISIFVAYFLSADFSKGGHLLRVS